MIRVPDLVVALKAQQKVGQYLVLEILGQLGQSWGYQATSSICSSILCPLNGNMIIFRRSAIPSTAYGVDDESRCRADPRIEIVVLP